MKTAKEREIEFRAALQTLLLEHNAELIITDDGKSYGMHSAICQISMASSYAENGDVINEYAEFTL